VLGDADSHFVRENSLNSSNSNRLADRLRRGELSAFETVATQFQVSLYRYFVSGGCDPNSAEEMTAETIARLIESFGRFRGDDSQIRAFVYSTARHVRSRHWERRSRSGTSIEEAENVASDCEMPAEALLRREQVDHLLSALGQLPETVREVVSLRYIEELSMSEIAAAMNMPEGTVKSHLHRGKKQLKTLLTQVEESQ